jgi:photosystem II stability/assembly factor-like uncharacterized protein
VWSLGSQCADPCTGSGPPVDAVLRGPASGDHLSATTGQPPLGDSTNVSVVAAGRDDAYVLNDIYGNNPKIATITHTRLFGTHDGGRTWHQAATPCPRLTFGRLYAGGADSLWALCQPLHGLAQLRRSTDGGSHWTTRSRLSVSTELQPSSAAVAWELTPTGEVFRTRDGGSTWTRVWFGGARRSSVLAGQIPPGLNRNWGAILTVRSPTNATVIAQVTSGSGHAERTNLVTYHTADGGETWRATPVRLPTG